MSARISVVVLTHNRLAEVSRTVEHLLALPERPAVIVVDNGSLDGTPKTLRQCFPQVRVVACEANLGAAGRNLGVAQVATEYVAFSDDDTRWSPGALAHVVRVLDASPCIGVLSARVLVGDEQRIDPTCERMKASPLDRAGLPGPALVGYMAGACVFRTQVFREAGGYAPRLFIGGEESLVSLDVLERGYAIVYCDGATLTHYPSPARDANLRRRMLARNAALVAWLRLPLSEAVAASGHALAVFAKEGAFVGDALALMTGIAWALPRRRVVSENVLRMRRQVREAEAAAAAIAPVPATAVAPDRLSKRWR
ncbi:MAG TPA: glycosyltransferase [Trinickia sp.]|uniref:glycosyltransferase family 2 protein n=1 Tax=Trinickia sp. TaxID=2571163 RepID=UPI002BF8E2FD|nr:glycosyltransferase [Trinickia sp.]HVW53538.1 glycosyltransferase [Trinickia sp.]